jgi:hypothetical protein
MDKKNVQKQKPNLLFEKTIINRGCDDYRHIFIFNLKKT